MKTPRDISVKDIIKARTVYGYLPTRQNRSHIRITTQQNGEHHLAIPNHNPIKTGTLNSIISQVAAHFSTTKKQVFQKLFG
jgi:predicted RNA binding protein YcfA (HicA-like mRNA interferase family)